MRRRVCLTKLEQVSREIQELEERLSKAMRKNGISTIFWDQPSEVNNISDAAKKELEDIDDRICEKKSEQRQLEFVHSLMDKKYEPSGLEHVDEVYGDYGFKNPDAMYRAIRSGQFPAIRFGKQYRINIELARIWLLEDGFLKALQFLDAENSRRKR
jgi:hypothetical protein